jgi:hypothetical protein
VSKDSYTSVYIPRELKRQLVKTAQDEDFTITRGRGSQLVQFIAAMLEEHNDLSQEDPTLSFLHRLTPELRSFIVKLSKMGDIQQKRACAMLDLLFDGNEPVQET